MDTTNSTIEFKDLTPSRASWWPGVAVAVVVAGGLGVADWFLVLPTFLATLADVPLLFAHALFLFLLVTLAVEAGRVLRWKRVVLSSRSRPELGGKTWMQASLEVAQRRGDCPDFSVAHRDHTRDAVNSVQDALLEGFGTRLPFYGILGLIVSIVGAFVFCFRLEQVAPDFPFNRLFLVVGATLGEATVVVLGTVFLSLLARRTAFQWRCSAYDRLQLAEPTATAASTEPPAVGAAATPSAAVAGKEMADSPTPPPQPAPPPRQEHPPIAEPPPITPKAATASPPPSRDDRPAPSPPKTPIWPEPAEDEPDSQDDDMLSQILDLD